MHKLYFLTCKVKSADKSETLTEAIKVGISKDIKARDIDREFNSLINNNAEEDQRETEVSEDLILELPRNKAEEFERYCIRDIFKNDKKRFSRKNEYFYPLPETIDKYNKLKTALIDNATELQKLNECYNDLKEDQEHIKKYFEDQYNIPFNNVKNKLIKTVIKNEDIKQNVVENESYDMKDFVAYKDEKKLYLKHKIYHKNFDIMHPCGSFKISLSNNKLELVLNNPGFKKFKEQYGYKYPSRLRLKRALEIFDGKILDLPK